LALILKHSYLFFGSRGTETGKLLWEKLKKKDIGEVINVYS
jgi:IS1 family transposase